jgi:hypothetical protein
MPVKGGGRSGVEYRGGVHSVQDVPGNPGQRVPRSCYRDLRHQRQPEVPKTGSYTAHFENKHEVRKKDRQQFLIELLTTGIALQQCTKVAAPVEAAALEGLDVVPFVSMCELDVKQQVVNTCASRALITALESMYCPTELEATSFKDIAQKGEGVGAAWLQPHLDVCDIEQYIIVVQSISMISDTQHHQLQLTALLATRNVCVHQDHIRPHCEHSNSAENGRVVRPRCASTRRRFVRPLRQVLALGLPSS